jgi:hypothetical protein
VPSPKCSFSDKTGHAACFDSNVPHYHIYSAILRKYTYKSVLPLARIFPCSKEILVHARNLQGNEMHKEMARKNTKIKGNCKDFCNLYQFQV